MSTAEFTNALCGLEKNLFSFALTYTRNEEDAKDLTQETIYKAIVYKDYYTLQTNMKAWVFTIMRNLFINQYNRHVKSRSIFNHSIEEKELVNISDNSNNTNNHMLGLELEKQLKKLPADLKNPLLMHNEGFKYKEISDKLELPIGTVKSRIFIARKKMMDLLPDYNYISN